MLKPNEANRLRELIGRRVSAVLQLHRANNVEAIEAADREDIRAARELADYITELETK